VGDSPWQTLEFQRSKQVQQASCSWISFRIEVHCADDP
jgi:hypothetical protein